MEFRPFNKIPRLRRSMVITEKIDGTNASICISKLDEKEDHKDAIALTCKDTDSGREWYVMHAGSRSRWLTPENDNFGFAAWAKGHQEELFALGVGHHFGEWWGLGINRGYGIANRKFSLFNVGRWIGSEDDRASEKQRVVPNCVSVVPVLYRGLFRTDRIDEVLCELHRSGSVAAPGFKNPEGVIVFHEASGQFFKQTIDGDDGHKTRHEDNA